MTSAAVRMRSGMVIPPKEPSSVVAVHEILRIPYVWTDRDRQGSPLSDTIVEVRGGQEVSS